MFAIILSPTTKLVLGILNSKFNQVQLVEVSVAFIDKTPANRKNIINVTPKILVRLGIFTVLIRLNYGVGYSLE